MLDRAVPRLHGPLIWSNLHAKKDRQQADVMLAEQISAVSELKGLDCIRVVKAGPVSSEIMGAVNAQKADLIVMAAHRRKHILDGVFGSSTAELVVRSGPTPVLIANRELRQRYDNVLIPVEPSEHLIRAHRLARAPNPSNMTRVIVLHSFVAIGKEKLRIVGGKPRHTELASVSKLSTSSWLFSP